MFIQLSIQLFQRLKGITAGVLSEKKPDTLPLIQKTHEDSVALFGLARLCPLEDLVFKHAETFRDLRGRSSEEERRETEDLWEAFRNRINTEEGNR